MRCLVTGGGTGGHIYPAIAAAESLTKILPRAEILFVGTAQGMESILVPKEGLRFKSIRSLGIAGKSPALALKGVWTAFLGISDAYKVIKEFGPDVVLGTGGYVSGPVVLTAALMGIPCAVQEQNVVPGKTNLVLSKIVDKTFTAWEGSSGFFSKRARVAPFGNPVRDVLFGESRQDARAVYGLGDMFTLLVLGGSRGAKVLVEIGLEIAKSDDLEIQMILITGPEYYEEAVASLGAKTKPGIDGAKYGNIILQPYVYKMGVAYKACDMVLARAGGMTLAEITALGLPSIIVPSPNVAGNHQEHNARALEAHGAAVVVREDRDAPVNVIKSVLRLLNEPALHYKMARAANEIGKPDAAKQIARELIALARRR